MSLRRECEPGFLSKIMHLNPVVDSEAFFCHLSGHYEQYFFLEKHACDCQ